MGLFEREILPRIVDKTCGTKEIHSLRAGIVKGLSGDVVEIGFGSGLNLAHLPPDVVKVLAVEPSRRARSLAAPRMADSKVPVEFVGLDGEDLAVPSESVDAALSTFTLCTIPKVHLALKELRRILRPGGCLHFLEHGLSPAPRLATWQHRLTPLQRRFFGGCHFDRPIDALLMDAGFEITELRNEYMRGPKTTGYLFEGIAGKT